MNTLNVNLLNLPIKRQNLVEWIKKKKKYDSTTRYLQETHLKTKVTNKSKVKRWKTVFHANGNKKKAGMAILIADKTDFKAKRQKITLYINERLIQQEI